MPDTKECIACGACANVCPARAIEFRDVVTGEKATRKMILHLDECHYSGQCSALCTTRDDDPPGVRHTTKFDLAGFDRATMVSTADEKELAEALRSLLANELYMKRTGANAKKVVEENRGAAERTAAAVERLLRS